MKTFTAAAKAAIAAGNAIVTGAVEVLSATPIRLWGGYGVLPLDGHTYQPIGDRALAQQSSASVGGSADGISLTLSGVDPEAIALLDAEEVRRAPAKLERLIFDGSGQTLLDHHVFTRGRLDPLLVRDVIGETATISTSIESAARGLGRKGGRMRTDADQRLISASDGFFKNVSYAASRTLYWGGQRPATAGVALPGASYGGGGNFLNQYQQYN